MISSNAHIAIFLVSYGILVISFVANCFLLCFSFTRKQKPLNKNSRRISKIILRYLTIGSLVYTIFSLVTTTIMLVRYLPSSDDMTMFRQINGAVGESFFIIIASLLCLLLYHRFTHMTSQALGKEPKIRKTRVKIYIIQAYAVGLLLFTISLLPILVFRDWLHVAIRILLVAIKSVSVMFILYMLFGSINGIRKEIMKRYSGYILGFSTLNGQFSYFINIMAFLVILIINELYDKLEYILVSPVLRHLCFLLIPIAYYLNDKNFKSYVHTRRLRRGKVAPRITSRRRRQQTTEVTNWVDTKTTLTICSRCKLPQPQREPGEIYSDDLQCQTCDRAKEPSTDENTGDEDDVISVISQIEALDLQRREISTPIKLLITSAFQIKAVHGLYIRESVVAHHWKRVSLERSKSQTQAPRNIGKQRVKQRSKSEQQPHQNKQEITTRNSYSEEDIRNSNSIQLEQISEPDQCTQ